MQSRVLSFTDPDEFQARVQATQTEVLTSGRGQFRADLTQLRFERLWMQRGRDSLPRIARATIDPNRTAVMFSTDSEQRPTFLSGLELTPGVMGVWGKATTNIVRTEGDTRWGSLSLPHEDMARFSEALFGRELVCPADTRLIPLPASSLYALRSIHFRAVAAATNTPDALADPVTANALELELVNAMVACLCASQTTEERSVSGQGARTVARFQQYLESRTGEPVYLSEICSAVGVSARLLRRYCQEMLGVSPVRYLWLRRMHLARQGLLHADPARATVTTVATNQGFWELGRFSVEYRALFGEAPSVTLRRTAR